MKINGKQGGILGGSLAVLLSAAIALFSTSDPGINVDNFKGELIETSTYELEEDHEYLTEMTINLDQSIIAGTAELVLNDEIITESMVYSPNTIKFRLVPIVVKPVTNLQLRLKVKGEYIAVGEFTNSGGLKLIVKEDYIRENK